MFYFNTICHMENKKGRAAVSLPFECTSFKLLWRESASLQVTVIHINISKYTVNRAPVSNRNCGRLSPMLLTPLTYEKLSKNTNKKTTEPSNLRYEVTLKDSCWKIIRLCVVQHRWITSFSSNLLVALWTDLLEY